MVLTSKEPVRSAFRQATVSSPSFDVSRLLRNCCGEKCDCHFGCEGRGEGVGESEGGAEGEGDMCCEGSL